MTRPEARDPDLEAWEARRADVEVPPGFADRVLAAVSVEAAPEAVARGSAGGSTAPSDPGLPVRVPGTDRPVGTRSTRALPPLARAAAALAAVALLAWRLVVVARLLVT